MSLKLVGGRRDDSIRSDFDPEQCQLCSSSLAHMTLIERQQHYDSHLARELGSPSSQIPLRPTPPQPTQKPTKLEKPKDPFWYAAQASAPPPNFAPGLISVINKALNTSHAKGKTQRAYLCYKNTVHVCSESFDRFWGCGYRNYQMACTALMDQSFQPRYSYLIGSETTPGVRSLQRIIEQAWSNGFDDDGANQLHKLVDTRKWIGTSDIWVAFSFLGIPSELVHFNCKKSSKGVQIVIDWVVAYFSAPSEVTQPRDINEALRCAQPVIVTDRMPLMLQHSGHSRTIVGYEVTRTGDVNLLVFDPAIRPRKRLHPVTLAASHNSYPSPPGKSPHRGVRRLLDSVSPMNFKRKKRRRNEENSEPLPDNENKSRTAGIGTQLQEQSVSDILKVFRVNSRNLQRHNAYQILYFPMTAPLNNDQRNLRKVVTAIEVQ